METIFCVDVMAVLCYSVYWHVKKWSFYHTFSTAKLAKLVTIFGAAVEQEAVQSRRELIQMKMMIVKGTLSSRDTSPMNSPEHHTSIDRRTRLDTWALLCVLSAIALTAYETDEGSPRMWVERWENILITTCTALTLSFSALACIAHMATSAKTGLFAWTILEGFVSLALVILWAVSLWVLSDPSKGLAQMYVGKSGSEIADYQAAISNANLYFASWGAGLCAFRILVDAIAMFINLKNNMPTNDITTTTDTVGNNVKKWVLLMISSLIVVGESYRFNDQVCSIESGTDDDTCKKNAIGFLMGRSLKALCDFGVVHIMLDTVSF